MEFRIYRNEYNEEEVALYRVDTNEVIAMGTDYDDDINGYIEGFIAGLDYCGIENTCKRMEYINKEHESYNLMGFYSQEN